MKSEFYQQLKQLASEILENPSPDIESLQQVSRQLYEKLTIVRYTEEIMEQFANLSANNFQADEEAIDSQKENIESQYENTEEFTEQTQEIEQEPIRTKGQEIPEDWSDQDIDQDEALEVLEGIEEKCACHNIDLSENIQQDIEGEDSCELSSEQTTPPEDENLSESKKDRKKAAEAQVSMFDFDLFDDKEIGYDPEEDLFEAKLEQDHLIQDYTPTSFSGFEVLDDDVDQQDEKSVEDEVEQQSTATLDDLEDEYIDETEKITDQILLTKHTINDTLGEEKHSPSLNERFAQHNNINVGLNDRLAFTAHLFDGDTEAFTASISYLSSLNDFGVAHEYITEILKPAYKNWTDKHMYEKRFMDIIMASFAAK